MRSSVCWICGVVVLFYASVASAQPWRDGQGPPRERRMDAKDFGDVERLERPSGDVNRMRPWDGPGGPMKGPRHSPPGKFNWGPDKNKYGGPKNGMKGWGGDPFKQFGSGRPWGYTERFPIIVIVTTEKDGSITVRGAGVKYPLRGTSVEAIIRSAR